MCEYFPELKSSGERVKVELDLSNYAIKADLKNATGIHTSPFAKKTDLTNSKSDVDKLDVNTLKSVPSNLNNLKSKAEKSDIGKLGTTPVDLSKLNNVLKKDFVKKMYVMLRSKILKTNT